MRCLAPIRANAVTGPEYEVVHANLFFSFSNSSLSCGAVDKPAAPALDDDRSDEDAVEDDDEAAKIREAAAGRSTAGVVGDRDRVRPATAAAAMDYGGLWGDNAYDMGGWTRGSKL